MPGLSRPSRSTQPVSRIVEGLVARIGGQREIDVGHLADDGPCESGRGNANDGQRSVVEDDLLSDDIRLPPNSPTP